MTFLTISLSFKYQSETSFTNENKIMKTIKINDKVSYNKDSRISPPLVGIVKEDGWGLYVYDEKNECKDYLKTIVNLKKVK